MHGRVRVRIAGPSDRPEVERIARASFDRVYAFFAVRGVRRARPFLIAEEEGEGPLGFLEGRVFRGIPPVGYVYFVAVRPTHRQRGVARALIDRALEGFREGGVRDVFAAVPRDNEASLELFKTFGFREMPRRILRQRYRWRGLAIEMQMVIAPHEVLLARTFAHPSPASPDVPRGP